MSSLADDSMAIGIPFDATRRSLLGAKPAPTQAVLSSLADDSMAIGIPFDATDMRAAFGGNQQLLSQPVLALPRPLPGSCCHRTAVTATSSRSSSVASSEYVRCCHRTAVTATSSRSSSVASSEYVREWAHHSREQSRKAPAPIPARSETSTDAGTTICISIASQWLY